MEKKKILMVCEAFGGGVLEEHVFKNSHSFLIGLQN